MAEEQLSKDEVWSVIDFSTALYGAFRGYGYFNPQNQYNQLLELENNKLIPTSAEDIAKALKAVPYDYKKLVGYSEFMEVFDAIYAKTLRYMKSLLAFDLSITCTNIKDPTEYSSKEYKDDLRRVYKFLDNFDYKQEFGNKVVPMLLRNETAYVWFRDTSDIIDEPIKLDNKNSRTQRNQKYALQIMPQDYCKLTGYFNQSQLLYDFDMTYFLNEFVDINLFAPVFKKYFNNVMAMGDIPYIPSSQLDRRDGTFAMWTQTSPLDGAYAFKMDISNFRQVPPFAHLMRTCFNNAVIEDLQKDKDLLTSRAFIYGAIRLFDNAKSGTQKNQFAIDPKTLGQLMAIVSGALKDKVQPVAMPTEENKMFQLSDSNKDMAVTQYNTSSGQGASANSLIFTTERMMQFELQQAIETDYAFMKPLYRQFNQFMNFFVNRKTKKYKFDFSFDGMDRIFHRKERQAALSTMMTNGFLPNASYIASVNGIEPQVFNRMLEESHYGGLTDMLTLPLNNNTRTDGSGNDGGTTGRGGRPTVSQTEISDSGASSREYESDGAESETE